jgi:hypothetical protein
MSAYSLKWLRNWTIRAGNRLTFPSALRPSAAWSNLGLKAKGK